MDARADPKTPIRVVLISLDRQLEAAVARAETSLRRELPGLEITLHAAADWDRAPGALDACRGDIATADFVVATMVFIEPQIDAILHALKARRDGCDAMIGCLAATEIVKLTKLGAFQMDKPASGPMALLKKLRGSGGNKSKAGASQVKMLRRLPKILKYIPGTAQDVRAYFLSMQYWLSGSDENLASLVRFLVNRYADGPRAHLRGTLTVAPPVEYPDTGVYHPDLTSTVSDDAARLPVAASNAPTVGVIVLRSYLLSGDTGHYDGVIRALEQRGMRVITAFSSGLDARDAIDRYFMSGGKATVDALVSLTGFSLVGGPAYNDASAAAEILSDMDVPYVTGQAIEFQALEEWGAHAQGLSPIESTLMVAIPELDGATGPIVFGGRAVGGATCTGCARKCTFAPNEGAMRMQSCPDRAEMLAARVRKLVDLRRAAKADRRVAITLFNFPPGGGGVGTAASLAVFESLYNTLQGLKRAGYTVGELPADADALRRAVQEGNASLFGTDANVIDRVPAATHIAREVRLPDIEAAWGPAPGRHLSDGRTIQILGLQLGNVMIGLQPGFGYEGDPMRLMFEGNFAPTHAFAAYYRYLREDFGAHAVLHFGTHGALEFMPGKQTGLSGACWPDYLIGDLPNFYFYAANNPSEAAIAKRRSAATTISYLTPAVTQAGLYKELADLRDTISRWSDCDATAGDMRARLASAIHAQATALDLIEAADPAEWMSDANDRVPGLSKALEEVENALIPEGLHVAGGAIDAAERADMLAAMAPTDGQTDIPRAAIEALVAGETAQQAAQTHAPDHLDVLERLARIQRHLLTDSEIPALIHALDGGFIPPVAGGDLITQPDILPTGRNIHGFDPYRLPSRPACIDGTLQADRLLERHTADGSPFPETVAVVLWGTDNLKSEGAQLAQALALMGATPRFDGYGRLAGADLIPLETLGRPRIDVVATLSGIFRDLLPMQSRLIADAAFAAATADEPETMNFIRKHAIAQQAALGCDLETAALRVFSNAEGAYGANVNQIIDSGCWEDEDELADAYAKRKCFAYGRDGAPIAQPRLLNTILETVDLAYQNLESVELGVTTIDHYFDTLGGIGRAVKRARGTEAPIYITDATRGDAKVRTLSEQISLESRTRTLNPKWYEGMLRHGYEG
ncbi:MAG: magnesium chelatase subunit H, partial [Pseudomonadota bacterium]